MLKNKINSIKKNKSIIKNLIKKININILNKNKEEAKNIFLKIQSFVDSKKNRNIFHKNKSSRYKSRIMKKINKII